MTTTTATGKTVSTVSNREKMLEKAKKLWSLAQAETNSSTAERESAMEKFRKILIDFNLSEFEAREHKVHEAGSVSFPSEELKIYRRHVLIAISELYFTDFFMVKKKLGTRRIFHPVMIGTPENIQITWEVYKWITRSIKAEADRLYTDPYERNDFCIGAADSVLKKAKAMQKKDEEKETKTPGTALAIVRNSLQKANEEFLNSIPLETGRRGSINIKDVDAMQAGQKFGNGINLDKQISGKKTKLIK